uniref:Exocyst complex component Sec6 n=1 Tax=Ascaris lumbricoides TaxID=6252 RepID=A0A9J2PTR4_ASCLU
MIGECSHLLEESFNDFVKYTSYICARALDIMRNKDREPRKQLELLLRIIEIDHKIDERYESLNVTIKQRPHCWRRNFFELIEQRIQERIEVFHVEKKSNNENWIARYLEICRMFIVEDLYAAKNFLRIFPKEHQLYDRFVLFYHKGISNKLCEIITSELDRREIVQLLNWIRIYPSEQLLGMPFLQVNAFALLDDYPLLPDAELERLQDQFINATKSEVCNWAIKAIRQEFAIKEKHRMENIEEDACGCYYTQLPYILFSIIHDQMSLAKEISDDMVPRIAMEMALFYEQENYIIGAVIALKNRIYDDREHVDFTAIMVTIANDLDMCIESTEKLRKYFPSVSNAALPQPETTSTSIVPVDLVKVYAEMPQKQDMPTKVYRDEGTSKKKQHFAMRSAIRGAVSTIKDIIIAKISPSPSSASLTELSTKMAKGREIFNVIGAPLMLEYSDGTTSSDSPIADNVLDSASVKSETSGAVCLDDDLQLASDAETPQSSAVEKFHELKGRFSAILFIMLKCSDAIDTICVTILDYYSDHKHLRSRLQVDLLTSVETRLIAEYISSIVNRELTCSNYEKRCLIAESLRRDANRINKTFQSIYQEQKCDENIADLSNILLRLADFISLNDKGMLSLEAASLIRDYPDMPSEVLFALIDIRDDMSSFESRALAEECVRLVDNRAAGGVFTKLLRLCKGERKKSQLIRDVVPRLRRKVKLSIA